MDEIPAKTAEPTHQPTEEGRTPKASFGLSLSLVVVIRSLVSLHPQHTTPTTSSHLRSLAPPRAMQPPPAAATQQQHDDEHETPRISARLVGRIESTWRSASDLVLAQQRRPNKSQKQQHASRSNEALARLLQRLEAEQAASHSSSQRQQRLDLKRQRLASLVESLVHKRRLTTDDLATRSCESVRSHSDRVSASLPPPREDAATTSTSTPSTMSFPNIEQVQQAHTEWHLAASGSSINHSISLSLESLFFDHHHHHCEREGTHELTLTRARENRSEQGGRVAEPHERQGEASGGGAAPAPTTSLEHRLGGAPSAAAAATPDRCHIHIDININATINDIIRSIGRRNRRREPHWHQHHRHDDDDDEWRGIIIDRSTDAQATRRGSSTSALLKATTFDGGSERQSERTSNSISMMMCHRRSNQSNRSSYLSRDGWMIG